MASKLVKFQVLCTLIVALFNTELKAAGLRSEIKRYTLMHDRFTVDRGLKAPRYQSFFDADAYLSSGLKKLIGDISSGTENEGDSLQKSLNMLEVLNKNINTEKMVDVDASLGIPLPSFEWKNYRFLPAVFYSQNLGAAFSISNILSTTNPTAQLYIKKDQKMGLSTGFKRRAKEEFSVALYKLDRADASSILTANDIATKGKLFDFGDLSQNHSMFDLDLKYTRHMETYTWMVELEELQLLSLDSDRKSNYGTRPMINARLEKEWYWGNVKWTPFWGLHYRKWYGLLDGLYAGANLSSENFPFSMMGSIGNQFITLIPQFNMRWLRLNYTMKTPYRNPQKDYWVATIHGLNLAVPFP